MQMGICPFGVCLQCLLFAHSPMGWKISRKTIPVPTSALRNPLRSCHGACIAIRAFQGGRCKTWPLLSEHKPCQHSQVVSCGGIGEVHIAKTFQCGTTARTISKAFCPILSPARSSPASLSSTGESQHEHSRAKAAALPCSPRSF